MSSVLAEFLQQFFTLKFTAGAVVLLGGKLAWMLLLFVPVIVYSAGKLAGGAAHYASRARQACRYSKYPARNHHRQSIVKAFSMRHGR